MKKRILDTTVRLARFCLDNRQIQARLKGLVRQAVHEVLNDESAREKLWAAANTRPDTADFHWAVRPNSVEERRYRLATAEAARFVTEHMPSVRNFAHPLHLLSWCMERLKVDGLILEFGVFSGTTINHIARLTERTVHGFDSFEGLPESWDTAPVGQFSLQGRTPEVDDNVELHVGWFDATLPAFVEQHPQPVALLHVDSDLYSSARTVLDGLREQIVPGTIIVFDEYFNYPTWRDHEHRAFVEFIEGSGKGYEYIGYTNRGFSVAVKIL